MKTTNFDRATIHELRGRLPLAIDDDDWLISIADKDALNARPKQRWGRVLFTNFQDVDLDTGGHIETPKAAAALAKLGGITLAQAEEIADFIKEGRALGKNIFANCHAGMCRSGAVVRVLLELGFEEQKYSGQPTRIPNIFVYNRIRKHFPELNQSWDWTPPPEEQREDGDT